MTTQKTPPQLNGSAAATARVDEDAFPAPKHRPPEAVKPAAAKLLAPVRAAMQKNPDVNLPDEAAGVITAGLTDPVRFRMLTEPHTGHDGAMTSLLNRKRVGEGIVFVTPQHDRFIDMGVIPDVAGARWVHTLHNRLDVETGELAAANLETAEGPHGPWAMLKLEVDDHRELAARVREAFAKTGPDHSTAGNDYTNSILQSGVKEPLLLVPMQVTFRDFSDDEYYLVSIDGNSRLVSMWKGRTGGNVDQAASACVETVIGIPAGTAWRRTTQRQVREALNARVDLINQGLLEDELTENTIRAGHTLTAPTVVVVGGQITDSANPLTDMVAAREDLIATIHTDATPWDSAAQAEQGMARVLRRATNMGLVTPEKRRVIEGRCTVDEMHDLLGLPKHRLWAVALTLQAILNPWYDGMRTLFREEFNSGNPTRLLVGKQVASTALSGYRSAKTISVAVNAFSDGGPIAETVWDHEWPLLKGSEPLKVLDTLLKQALDGDTGAIAQLCVLGGTAGMLNGLISRDRGSKQTTDGKRTVRQVPFRTRPYRIVEQLAGTAGGLKTLHSMAVSHVTGKPAKRFHSIDNAETGTTDGDPVYDKAGAQANLEMEWDVVVTAGPVRAAEAISAAGSGTNGTSSDKPEQVRLREKLRSGADSASDAVARLTELAQTLGVDVFGSYDTVDLIKNQLQDARDALNANGPKQQVILDEEDEDEE